MWSSEHLDTSCGAKAFDKVDHGILLNKLKKIEQEDINQQDVKM